MARARYGRRVLRAGWRGRGYCPGRVLSESRDWSRGTRSNDIIHLVASGRHDHGLLPANTRIESGGPGGTGPGRRDRGPRMGRSQEENSTTSNRATGEARRGSTRTPGEKPDCSSFVSRWRQHAFRVSCARSVYGGTTAILADVRRDRCEGRGGALPARASSRRRQQHVTTALARRASGPELIRLRVPPALFGATGAARAARGRHGRRAGHRRRRPRMRIDGRCATPGCRARRGRRAARAAATQAPPPAPPGAPGEASRSLPGSIFSLAPAGGGLTAGARISPPAPRDAAGPQSSAA